MKFSKIIKKFDNNHKDLFFFNSQNIKNSAFSILKNFSFFYNKLYFKSVLLFKIKKLKKSLKLSKKAFLIKKWLFFTKFFKFITLKKFFLKDKWVFFIKRDLTKLKNFLFLLFFKRINSKFFKKTFKNPLIFYHSFSFKLVKLLVSLKAYKLYNRKYKKKFFDVSITKKLFAILKSLKISKINLFINFLVYSITWVKNNLNRLVLKVKNKKNLNKLKFKNNKLRKINFFLKNKVLKSKIKFYSKIRSQNLKFHIIKKIIFKNKLKYVLSKLKLKNFKPIFVKSNFFLNSFLYPNYRFKKNLNKLNLKKKNLLFFFKKKIIIKKPYRFNFFLISLKAKYFFNWSNFVKKLKYKKNLFWLKKKKFSTYYNERWKQRKKLKKIFIKKILYRFKILNFKKSSIKIFNSLKIKKKIFKYKKNKFFFRKKSKFFFKTKFKFKYFFSKFWIKNFSPSLVYKFFFLKRNYKFLKCFKNINAAKVNAFKNLNFKKTKLIKNKKKIIGKNFFQIFKKYRSFKKFFKFLKRKIPNFFLNKKKWKLKNFKFKINRFLVRFFKFQKVQKKLLFENNFKRFGNYRRYFSWRSKFLWDRKSFLNFKRVQNSNLRFFKSKKLNFFFRAILKISVLKIFYSFLLKNKKKNLIFFNSFLNNKNLIIFLKRKLIKKCTVLIKNLLNVFFFKLLTKKINFKSLTKKLILIKKLILNWFLKKNFHKNSFFFLNKQNSIFFSFFKTKFKSFFLKHFFKIYFIWNYFLFKNSNTFFILKNSAFSFKFAFFKFKFFFFKTLQLENILTLIKKKFLFPNFFLINKKSRKLKKRKRKILSIYKYQIKKQKVNFFFLAEFKKKFLKFFSFAKKKYLLLKYKFKTFFYFFKKSFWFKTKFFFQKLYLSFYWYFYACKESYKINSFNLLQIFYILKFSLNPEAVQDSDFQKRKTFSLRRFNSKDRRSAFKRFLMISKFSKKFYLYKRFFKYLKILKKIKNQLFFKQKKFTELFFYRLDVCLFEIKLFGSLKTVRQLINLNYIYLNMKIENKLNYFLKILDVITVCKKANWWLCIMLKNTKRFLSSLGWPIFKFSFKESFLMIYKTQKTWYEFKFNLSGLGLTITSHLKFKFRKFKKDAIFSQNLVLHKKQILFLLNFTRR